MKSRRQFFKLAGTGILAAGVVICLRISQEYVPPVRNTKDIFSLGMAGYTFKGLSIERTIEIMNYIGVNYLSVKDFHMPMDSTQEQINSVIGKFRAGRHYRLYCWCYLYEDGGSC